MYNSLPTAQVIPTLNSGIYTPTYTIFTNMNTMTGAPCLWTRIGNIVHVSGIATPNITLANSGMEFHISLPIASAFVASANCSGTAGSIAAGAGIVAAYSPTGTAAVSATPLYNGLQTYTFIFSYQIL